MLKKYIFIALGGVLGALARYLLHLLWPVATTGGFPLATLLINVAGSFVLAWLIALPLGSLKLSPEVKLGLTTGFLGAFTTFSTFSKETVLMLQNGAVLMAGGYVIVSLLFGLLAAWCGMRLAESRGEKS